MKITDSRLRISASDLANFVACRHQTRLDLAAAHKLVSSPSIDDLGAEALAQRGDEHEAQVLNDFRAQGWTVEDLSTHERDRQHGADATVAAMHRGVDVIYQGTLLADHRLGLPDFLVRADLLNTPFGHAPGYEVIDAKLARSAKARAVLQTSFYSELLAGVQDAKPLTMHLALGGHGLLPLRVADYAAYTRQVHTQFVDFTSDAAEFPPTDTHPEPVEHCAVCRWRLVCKQQRRADDDLSLIAGITARQRKALKQAGVTTRRGFAKLETPPTFDHVTPQSMAKAHAQARLQVAGEDAGHPLWEFVEPERTDTGGELAPNRGLTALPPPSIGDLFFDIEGARYYSEDGKEYGLQYLFGIVDTADRDGNGQPRYHRFWSFNRTEEKQAFQEIVDFIIERRQRHPDLHVYHYNHYEPTAFDHLSELHETREDVIGRLMGRFATRETEVDDLLRGRVFVDLYRVVRQGIRASVESYSIKRLEPLFGFERQVRLHDVNERMVQFEIDLDTGKAASDHGGQSLIQGYNEDDCRSTLGLRDWLEERRADLADQVGEIVPRPVPPEPQELHVDAQVEALREQLLAGLPEHDRTAEQRARSLMADLLEWHRRDAKPGWWRFFHLQNLTDDELVGESDAIGGLELQGVVGEVKQSHIWRYRFPAQQHSFRAGDRTVDPDSGKEWTIYELDEAAGTLDLSRGKKNENPHPTALMESGPIKTENHRQRLLDLANEIVEQGEGEWRADARFDLLLGRCPRFTTGPDTCFRLPDEKAVDAGRRLAVTLSDSYLAIQGPPGSGKTYTAAKQVSDLVGARLKVGITANSHAVITNVLDEFWKQNELGRPLLIAQKPKDKDSPASSHATTYTKNGGLLDAIGNGTAEVIGATTWTWTCAEFRNSVDVLIVDEASQMSLANVLAAAHAAPKLILLGDPQQLQQPSPGSHPPEAGVSALGQVLGEHVTMPEDRGLFIERTRRMHPKICKFTSEMFYESRLSCIAGLENQAVLGDGPLSGAGLRLVDVVHEGNDSSSPEEADVVAGLVTELRAKEWRASDGTLAPVGIEGILIVTPFNAQIREIETALTKRGITGARVGTVDKFQGQQAPVVIYSMASSTAEDAPRGMEFLYDLHRLNVATSRARCLAILVSSPELVRVACHTPRRILLANALCRFRELAD